jgi:hypothetical protein
LDTEKYVRASISACSAWERIARGNATFRMYGKYLKQNESRKLVWEDTTSMVSGNATHCITSVHIKKNLRMSL